MDGRDDHRRSRAGDGPLGRASRSSRRLEPRRSSQATRTRQSGPRMASDDAPSASQDDGRDGRVRPAHHDATRRRRCASTASSIPLHLSAADRSRDQAARLLGPDRRAEAPLRGEPRARPLVRRQGPGALPRQHLHAARRRRRRLPADPVRDPRASTSSACRRSSSCSATSRAASILVTGPTGSGKSTTLAAMIDKINTRAAATTSSRSRTRSSSSTSTRTASSTSARSHADTHSLHERAASRPARRIPTSCSSARCATSRRSRPRCASPRPAT